MQNIFTKNGVAIKVDNEDFLFLNSMKWRVINNKSGNLYAVTGWSKIGVKLMHRIIMNARNGIYIDHINHDTLDNRKSNLRICTQSENMMNVGKNKGNYSSKFKGVCLRKNSSKIKKKWRASIWYKGKFYHIGSYELENDAAIAYNNKAKELFGDFAYMNNV